MKKRKLNDEQVKVLLSPIVNLDGAEQVSISAIQKNPDAFIKKVMTTQKPLWLSYKAIPFAIVVNPQVYSTIETKRRQVVGLLEGVDLSGTYKPSVARRGALPVTQGNIQEVKLQIRRIEQLQQTINRHKCDLCELEEDLEAAERELNAIPAFSINLPLASASS